MAKKQKFTKKQIKDALEAAGGFVTKAAKMLNCECMTVYNYINRYDDIKEFKKSIDERYLDLAESKLIGLMNDSNLGALCFFLKCKGKSRGYYEKTQQDITSSDGSLSKIKIVGVGDTEES